MNLLLSDPSLLRSASSTFSLQALDCFFSDFVHEVKLLYELSKNWNRLVIAENSLLFIFGQILCFLLEILSFNFSKSSLKVELL